MTQVSPDRTQTLEVLGTRNLLNVLRNQLEAEGVGITTTKADPPKPVIIEPLQERTIYDIAIPITKPRRMHDIRRLSELDPSVLKPIFEQEDLAEVYRVRLKLEFATTETEIHQAAISAGELPTSQELLGSITNKVIDRTKLPNHFAQLYPLVRDYVATRCFGKEVDLDRYTIRSHLSRLEIQEGIAKYLAREISELTIERRTSSSTRPTSASPKRSRSVGDGTCRRSWRRRHFSTTLRPTTTSSAGLPSSSTLRLLMCCDLRRWARLSRANPGRNSA